jgi:hypothetical protein
MKPVIQKQSFVAVSLLSIPTIKGMKMAVHSRAKLAII